MDIQTSGKDSDGSRYDQSEAIAGDRAGGRYPADQRRMVSVIFKCGTYTAIVILR